MANYWSIKIQNHNNTTLDIRAYNDGSFQIESPQPIQLQRKFTRKELEMMGNMANEMNELNITKMDCELKTID